MIVSLRIKKRSGLPDSPLPLGGLCRNGISQPLVQHGERGGGREGAQDNMDLHR